MKLLDNITYHNTGLKALRMFIGFALLFRLSTELPFASYLWHNNGLGQSSNSLITLFLGTSLNIIFANSLIINLLVIIMILACIGFIFDKYIIICNFILWLGFLAIESRLPLIGDGGDNIVHILLFFLLFTCSRRSYVEKSNRLSFSKKVRIWNHNMVIILIFAQICIIYFVSGSLKIWGDMWMFGVATFHISQVEWFSTPSLREIFTNPIVATISSYGTFIFQTTFPIAIFSKLKYFWILFGLMLHISIAIFMGLVAFSTVMIGLELFLLSDEEYYNLQKFINGYKHKIRHKFQKVV